MMSMLIDRKTPTPTAVDAPPNEQQQYKHPNTIPNANEKPHQNPQVALQEILTRFYADFPPHSEETKYNYVVSSSMKPTQVRF